MYSFLINSINAIIRGLGAVLNALFLFLPPSPFTLIDNSPIAPYLSGINYFIPISIIITISELWLACIGTYYLYQIVLRWIKAIK